MKCKRIMISSPWKFDVGYDEVEVNLSPTEVLVKAAYTAISPGTEVACISGMEGWFPLPGIPGYCAAGEVVQIGGEVSKFKVGDKVFYEGNHREYLSFPIF